MSTVLAISASPFPESRTDLVATEMIERLSARGHEAAVIRARDLPTAALLRLDRSHPAIAALNDMVRRADGLILATPVFQASCSGLLKVVLDSLPHRGFTGKVVLPVATGGSAAHVLAVDSALHPILGSMGADQVLRGLFVSESGVTAVPGGVLLGPGVEGMVEDRTQRLHHAISNARYSSLV